MALEPRIRSLAKTVLKAAQEIKAKDIVALDLSEAESYTDFVLIVSGGSDRQVRAIADNIIAKAFEKHRMNPLGLEGYAIGEWVLIDFGDVVAHVFFDQRRRHYHLEDMWLPVAPIAEAEIMKHLNRRATKPGVPGRKTLTSSRAGKGGYSGRKTARLPP